MKRSINY